MRTLRKGKKRSGSDAEFDPPGKKQVSTHWQLLVLFDTVTRVNAEPGDQAPAKSSEKVFLSLFKRLCPTGRAGSGFQRWQGQNRTRASMRGALGLLCGSRHMAAGLRPAAFCWFRVCSSCLQRAPRKVG